MAGGTTIERGGSKISLKEGRRLKELSEGGAVKDPPERTVGTGGTIRERGWSKISLKDGRGPEGLPEVGVAQRQP